MSFLLKEMQHESPARAQKGPLSYPRTQSSGRWGGFTHAVFYYKFSYFITEMKNCLAIESNLIPLHSRCVGAVRVWFKDDQHLLSAASLRLNDVSAPVLQVKRMFKKHPGRKVTEGAESQPNSVQTAGKSNEAEGDFIPLPLLLERRLMKWFLSHSLRIFSQVPQFHFYLFY